MKRRKAPKNPPQISTRAGESVRAIARERVGTVKPSQAILPKTVRKKPKYKKSLDQE